MAFFNELGHIFTFLFEPYDNIFEWETKLGYLSIALLFLLIITPFIYYSQRKYKRELTGTRLYLHILFILLLVILISYLYVKFSIALPISTEQWFLLILSLIIFQVHSSQSGIRRNQGRGSSSSRYFQVRLNRLVYSHVN